MIVRPAQFLLFAAFAVGLFARAAPANSILRIDLENEAVLQSPVPVVVYVSPPGTMIGAAHPVSVGRLPGLPSEPEPQEAEGTNKGF